jgi:hypothetical protein
MKTILLLHILAFTTSLFAKVEVFEISKGNVDLLPEGKEADGIIGDFLIRNKVIECVIGGSANNRKANMGAFWGADGVTPGCLYDLSLRGSKNDQLTIFSPSRQQGRVSYVRPSPNGNGVEVVVSSALSGSLFKKHLYQIKENEAGITIDTLLRNEGAKPISGPISDRWTRFNASGNFESIEWADSVDPSDKAGFAYAWLPDENGKVPPKSKTLNPGDEIKIKRFVAVGESPAHALGVVAAKLGKTGGLKLTITETGNKPVSTASVDFQLKDSTVRGYPDEKGKLELLLPEGLWKVSVTDIGRERKDFSLEIKDGQPVEKNISMDAQSGIHFSINKENGSTTPCKVQFIGLEGTPSPKLGPGDRAHGCKDQYHSEKGNFSVALDPGKYKLIITRGIEHDHIEKTVVVPKGKYIDFGATLKRTVETPGWVSTDFHNHSTPSGDNVCATADRLINLAAEHIEFAPTTEHNRIMDWTPYIESLGLKGEISTISGMELTGSGAHLNAFPLTPKPYHQDNGAPQWVKDPRINALNLRNHSGHHPTGWIHINHPDMIENFMDRNKDGKFDNGYQGILSLIDAIETENYRPATILSQAPFRITRRASREQVTIVREFVWLQMLNHGMRTWGIAVSDAHAVHGNGVGGWRTFVRSSTDDPAKIDWAEISRRSKAGQMILSSGPYLEVETADGIQAGGLARANGTIDLKIRVQCSSWIDIDRIQILVNGRQVESLNFTRKSHPKFFSDEVIKFENTIPVPLAADAHLIVVAYGENFDLKTGFGTSGQSAAKPCAYNNPIFVDLDGNGFTPNGDSLGFPLPSGRISVSQAKEQLNKAGLSLE